MSSKEPKQQSACLCFHCRVRQGEKTCFADEDDVYYDAEHIEQAKAFWQVISDQVVKEKNRAQALASIVSSKVMEIVKFLGNAFVDMPLDIEHSTEVQADLFAMPESIRMCSECHCFFSRKAKCHCKKCMGEDYRSHYVILMHGVIAEPFCMAYVAQALLANYPNLFIYFPHKIAGKSLVGLELVLQMYSSELHELFVKIPKQIKLSVIGHSFGGIILRTWLFYYHRKTPGVYIPKEPAQDEEKKEGAPEAQNEPLAGPYEPPEIQWCNYISFASPHSGIYENNAAFRKVISLAGSKSIDELDNQSVDLLLLVSEQGLESIKQFQNMIVYGNLWGDHLVAPRTSMLLPRYRINSTMIKAFTKNGEEDPGEPHAILDLMSKYEGPRPEDDVGDGVESSVNREEAAEKLIKAFYARVAKVILKTSHVNKLMFDSDKPIIEGDDDSVCRQVFTEEDIKAFTKIISDLVVKASDKLVERLLSKTDLLYQEVLLTALWELTPYKFAVYMPIMCMPHKSIVTPMDIHAYDKLTNKVLTHAADRFIA
ncbi:serine esterase domain containing protein [Babesia ovata]|uniref:Serine esterase domain containing protein n=1 Tax=Babesia ovata TaxID=189622 RepID=A0A2H6KAF1_9APIC|nr:serine esterase domain containing protein [Babesia ovata]GBE59929.1 serine esterase domain containing protein [Babesia ovata]